MPSTVGRKFLYFFAKRASSPATWCATSIASSTLPSSAAFIAFSITEAIFSNSNGTTRPSRFSICGMISRYRFVSRDSPFTCPATARVACTFDADTTDAFAIFVMERSSEVVMGVGKRRESHCTPACQKPPVDISFGNTRESFQEAREVRSDRESMGAGGALSHFKDVFRGFCREKDVRIGRGRDMLLYMHDDPLV